MGSLQLTSNARFDNATLDALLPYLSGYFNFRETSENFTNAVHPRLSGLSRGGAVTYGAAGKDSGGVSFADGVYLAAVSANLIDIGSYAEFQAHFWINFTDATPAAGKALFCISPTVGTNPAFELEIDTGGNLNLFIDGSFRLTGTTVLSDATDYFISIRRYSNAGTPTWELLINNASEGTTTGAADTFNVLLNPYFFFGRIGSTLAWNPGILSAFSVWKTGDSGIVSALYNSGTGRFLVGV